MTALFFERKARGHSRAIKGQASLRPPLWKAKIIFQVSLGFRREAMKTSTCLASASSAVEVRDHHHEVRLGHRIILVYDMSM